MKEALFTQLPPVYPCISVLYLPISSKLVIGTLVNVNAV